MPVIMSSAIPNTVLFFVIFVVSTTNSEAQTENQSMPPISEKFNCNQLLTDNQLGQSGVYKYVGCSFSKKFHRPSCIFAKAINRHHIVLFQWRKQAISAQYQPCRYCLPPIWLSTHCILLPSRPKTRPANHT
jgi:hypothetical protein